MRLNLLHLFRRSLHRLRRRTPGVPFISDLLKLFTVNNPYAL